jgi:uncharacterized membrane protein YqiK
VGPLVLAFMALAACGVIAIALFVFLWRRPAPGEALIVLPARRPADGSLRFKIVVPAGGSRGTLVLPGLARARRLPLSPREIDFVHASLRVHARYRVGDDYSDIAQAVRRFLDQPLDARDAAAQSVLANQIDALAVSTSASAIATDCEGFARQVADRSAPELKSRGLVVESLQVSSSSGAGR